jgi:hypothetical protein
MVMKWAFIPELNKTIRVFIVTTGKYDERNGEQCYVGKLGWKDPKKGNEMQQCRIWYSLHFNSLQEPHEYYAFVGNDIVFYECELLRAAHRIPYWLQNPIFDSPPVPESLFIWCSLGRINALFYRASEVRTLMQPAAHHCSCLVEALRCHKETMRLGRINALFYRASEVRT